MEKSTKRERGVNGFQHLCFVSSSTAKEVAGVETTPPVFCPFPLPHLVESRVGLSGLPAVAHQNAGIGPHAAAA